MVIALVINRYDNSNEITGDDKLFIKGEMDLCLIEFILELQTLECVIADNSWLNLCDARLEKR